MNKRVSKIFLISLCCMMWLARTYGAAQSGIERAQTTSVQPSSEPVVERDSSGRVRVKAARGEKVLLGNRTTGRITVTGWDGDTIEALAVSSRGAEMVRVWTDVTPSGTVLAIKADYADSDRLREERPFGLQQQPGEMSTPAQLPATQTPTPSPSPASTPMRPGGQMNVIERAPFEIHLEVKLPRNAELDVIKVMRSDVQVTGINTPVTVSGDRSSIVLKQVGAAEVRTRSGNVEVENASGLVDVITTSGAISVHNAGADVRALSISGPIEIRCARGRVDVSNTDGPIELLRIGGDVDANAASSSVHLTGVVRAEGRYYLKSMSGRVEMTLPANSQGFTAALSTYRGTIENDFPLKIKQSSEPDALNHRTIGRFGDGRAQIMLDSFEGLVKLSKAAQGALPDCR